MAGRRRASEVSGIDAARHHGQGERDCVFERAEAVDGTPHMQVRNLAALKAALEKTGLIFLDGDYSGRGGAGVRLPARRLLK